MMNVYKNCNLCPRNCQIDRSVNKGYCKTTDKLLVTRAALHMWEEPCISGDDGSGTIFFGGCNLGCIYCQNAEIRDGKVGREISVERLSEIFFELKEKGANNINLVTPTHFVPHIIQALDIAKRQNLNLPVVYNTGGYEKVETLKMLNGYVDVYLPDFKYYNKNSAKKYSNAPDYTDYVKPAIDEMLSQVGNPVFSKDGIIKKGVIVRHLLLPKHSEESKEIIKYLYDTYNDDIFISIMNQYTPMPQVADHSILKNKVTQNEYDDLVDYAVDIGVENGFIQEGETAMESFIPSFDNTGV
ncbi:MAG: radical SAM protein [Clostridia bacterium]|nr:radical SAM protein [Clostridia bacterium]